MPISEASHFSTASEAPILIESGKGTFAVLGGDAIHSYRQVCDMTSPVIAVIDGGCVGEQLEMAVCADYRIATRSSYFALGVKGKAIFSDVEIYRRMKEFMSDGMIRELAFTGRQISSDESLKTDLVDKVVEDFEEAILYAEVVAAKLV